jgi:hypothetical protein
MSPPMRNRRRLHVRLLALCLAVTLTTQGCASMTGLVTGAFTGAVDAPAQIYRLNRGEFDRHPEYWVWNLLVFVPVGIAAGPIAGFAKGVGLDVGWFLDRVNYDRVFNTYREASVWRPYTLHW